MKGRRLYYKRRILLPKKFPGSHKLLPDTFTNRGAFRVFLNMQDTRRCVVLERHEEDIRDYLAECEIYQEKHETLTQEGLLQLLPLPTQCG